MTAFNKGDLVQHKDGPVYEFVGITKYGTASVKSPKSGYIYDVIRTNLKSVAAPTRLKTSHINKGDELYYVGGIYVWRGRPWRITDKFGNGKIEVTRDIDKFIMPCSLFVQANIPQVRPVGRGSVSNIARDEKTVCTCDIRVLMDEGCKCGGFAAEQARKTS